MQDFELRIKSVGFTSRLELSMVYAVIKTPVLVSQGDWRIKYEDRVERN